MKKKILLFLSITLALMSSCSSEDMEKVEIAKGDVYPVIFNVSGFKGSSTPMAKTNLTKASSRYCQFVIYNNNGIPVMNDTTLVSPELTNEHTVTINLAEGDYKAAILMVPTLQGFPNHSNYSTLIKPSNFETDFAPGIHTRETQGHNTGVYYESISFSVNADQSKNTNHKVSLSPMWNELSVNILNNNTCEIPEDATQAHILVAPSTYGFYLKSKKFYSQSINFTGNIYSYGACSIESFKAKGFTGAYSLGQADEATVKVVFTRPATLHESPLRYIVLLSQDIYTGSIKVGEYFTLEGDLTEGNSSIPNDNFAFSVKELTDGGTIAFGEGITKK